MCAVTSRAGRCALAQCRTWWPTRSARLSQRAMPAPPEHGAALERTWQFSRAGEGQRVGAAALGAANVAGVAYLGGLLAAPGAAYTLARNGLGFMLGLFPALQARTRLRAHLSCARPRAAVAPGVLTD